MATSTTAETLGDVPLFSQLPHTDLEALGAQAVLRRYARNHVIFSQGDPGDGLYVLTEGRVVITRSGADGNELILTICEPEEAFGELALVDQEPRSASAVALEDCSALFLSSAAFSTFLHAHPEALFACLRAIVRQLRRCTELADEIALLDVRSRLARRLVRLAEQGAVSRPGIPPPRFNITQQQLASMTGASRESVNKHLAALADEGVIELDRGHVYIIDMDRLAEIGVCRV